MGSEGGYQADPNDKGNFGPQPHTYKGIAGGYHPTWPGWKIVNAYRAEWRALGKSLATRKDWLAFSQSLKQSRELQPLVLSFYESLYWDPLHLDLVASQSVANQLCDHGVNAGTGRVGWMLQWVLRVSFNKTELALDGDIGTKTLKALASVPAAAFFARFAELRRDFYRYRAGDYQAEPRLLALHQFFRTKLGLKTNPTQKKYLRTWLQRVQDIPFTS